MYLHPGRDDCQFFTLGVYECRCHGNM